MASYVVGLGRRTTHSYLRYRNSGVEWLGEVPEHWEVKRLSLIGSFFKGGGGTKEDEVENGVPCVRYGDIYTQHQYFIRETRSDISEESAAKYTPIHYGDILFAGSGETIEEIGKSAANLIEGPAYCGGDVIVLRPVIESDATFLGYAADCSTSTYQKAYMGRGVTVMHIYGQELKRLLLPLPPIDEQRAIGAFLDRETERIDSLVAKMRLLIERLGEYRTALITRTVTGGLPPETARLAGVDPSPRLKPSGMEWLGEVPEHWEVKRLEHVAFYRTSSVDKKTEEDELPVRLCNYTDVYYGDRIRVSEGEFMNATASTSEVQRFRLLVGDILVTKDSEDWRDIAVPAIVDETADDFVCGYHLGVIRSGPGIHPLFLYRALQSEAVNRQLQVSASGVTRYGLSNAAVGDVVLPLPPIDEQRAIGAFLDRETVRIDSLVAKMRLLIERLGEYRAALITAAVTGKIDVRGSAESPEAHFRSQLP